MADTPFKKTTRFLLSVLLAFSVAVTLLSCVLHYALGNRTAYREAAYSPAFIESVHQSLLESLESDCLFYDLPFETLKTAVSQELVKTLVVPQMSSVYAALFVGESLPAVEWDGNELTQAIQSFFNTLPEEDRPSPTTAQTITDDLVVSLSPIFNIGLSDKLLQQGHSIVQKTVLLQQIATLTWLWLLVSVVLAVGLWLVTPKHVSHRLQNVAGMLFFGSAFVAVPLWLLKRYDLPSRLVLAESSLKRYVNSVLYQIIDYSVFVTSIVFAVSALLLVTAVVLRITKKQ